MNTIKKTAFLLLCCLSFLNTPISGRNGGAIAGGVLGGMVLGSAITAASQPRYDYDYRRQYDDEQRSYDDGYARGKRRREIKKENEELRKERKENEELKKQQQQNSNPKKESEQE